MAAPSARRPGSSRSPADHFGAPDGPLGPWWLDPQGAMVLTGARPEGQRRRPHKIRGRPDPSSLKPGLAARQAAARLLAAVTESRASLDGLA
jgi:hypothetical protein